MGILQTIVLLILTPFLTNGQVLLELLDNARHSQVADTYRQNNIKRIYYTIKRPFLLSMTVSSYKKESASEWRRDTITFSTSYLKNGLIENERQTLPNGDVYYLKEYFFDSIGNLVRTIETSNKRIRFYDYQEMTYYYQERQITRIDKIRFKNSDTTRTTTVFSYSGNNLEKVIEKGNNNGDTLLSSYFIYNIKKHYIEEKNFIEDFCKMWGTFYYTLDNKGRVVMMAHGLNGYKKNLEPDREISYDFSREIPNENSEFVKIEKYDL